MPLMDGTVHVSDRTGSELPGWPVETRADAKRRWSRRRPAVSRPWRARRRPGSLPCPAVADIDGDGAPEAVTTAGIRVYAWESSGEEVNGFPVTSDLGKCGAARKPTKAFASRVDSSPALRSRDFRVRTRRPDIVVPGLNGYLYAFSGQGDAVPGYPAVVDPDIPTGEQMLAESTQPCPRSVT